MITFLLAVQRDERPSTMEPADGELSSKDHQERIRCDGNRVWSHRGAHRDRCLGGNQFGRPHPQSLQNLQQDRRQPVKCPLASERVEVEP